jgi:hypothetical protein
VQGTASPIFIHLILVPFATCTQTQKSIVKAQTGSCGPPRSHSETDDGLASQATTAAVAKKLRGGG